MKKIFLFVLVVGAITNSMAQKYWSVGVYTNMTGNHSKYTAGMSDANGRFNNNAFGAGTFGFVGRYFLTDHWSFQSGANVSQIGFEYSLSNDYSLLKKHDKQATKNNIGIGVLQVPLTAIYAFKPNCRNVRFFIGGGVSMMSSFDNVHETRLINSETNEGITNNVYVNQTVTSDAFTTLNLQMMWGVEKLLKRGGIIQFGFTGNKGFNTIATSEVTYSIDNKTYSHTFTNKGNYGGFMLNYYFRPFQKRAK